jgi:drug/metabolite transporter (DMT)-like permease
MVIAAVLAAAVLHAGWNAIAKSSDDRLGLFARSSMTSLALAIVLCVLTPLPQVASWPWLIASALIHTLYNIGLVAAYRLGDFNQAYPVARGIGPLLVAVVAAMFLGEPLPPVPTAGVVLIAAAIGVLGLTPWHKVAQNRAAIGAAVLTGVTIAAYTIIDGIGVRLSGSPVGYLAWMLGLHCATVVAAAHFSRRRAPAGQTRAGWGLALLTGAMSMLAYGLVLWAQTRGALAAIAALRESSVVVAAVIGALLFKEPLGRLRIAASVAVAAGVVLVATFR